MSHPDERARFLAEWREVTRRRYDELHSPDYDAHWGGVSATHADFVRDLIRRVTAEVATGAQVLDAACGTGKYWPMLLGAGFGVVGLDQSTGMLAQARLKHPDVSSQPLALQELRTATGLHGRFDAVMCVDAMEFVGPEDWPAVLDGFVRALRGPSLVYLTVEQSDEPVPGELSAGEPSLGEPSAGRVTGESVGDGYHFYPSERQVRAWVAGAGLAVVREETGDGYWHLLLHRG